MAFQPDAFQTETSYPGLGAFQDEVITVNPPVGITYTRGLHFRDTGSSQLRLTMSPTQRTTGSVTARFSRGINVREVGS